MNVRQSSITASSSASTPSEVSHASVPPASHSTRLPVSVSTRQERMSVAQHSKQFCLKCTTRNLELVVIQFSTRYGGEEEAALQSVGPTIKHSLLCSTINLLQLIG